MQQALSAVTQIAKELGRLHRQCVIHCDIKPANLHQSEDDAGVCSIWVWRFTAVDDTTGHAAYMA